MKNKKNHILHFALYIIFIPILFSISGCSSPTETPIGELSGLVNLEDMQDHSGIVIAIYDLAYLDTTIVRINNQYPQIGVHINQHTEFDHRLQSAIKTTETHTDGSFEITKIPIGIYNLVVIKGGWGFKYLYEIAIVESENDLNDVILLYEEIHISGNISDNIVVATDHHLVIDDDTDFIPNTSSFTIHPGAVVRINPGVDLTIHGNLFAQGEENNMFWITSNDGFENLQLNTYNSTLPNREIGLYNSMVISSIASVSDDLIEWGKWSWANIALDKQVGLLNANKMLYYNCGCGLKLSDCDNSNVSNIISSKCLLISEAGIVIGDSDDSEISNSILIGNYNGIHCKLTSNINIINNYFYSNTCGIWGLTLLGEILNNVLVNNSSCDFKLASNIPTGIIDISSNILMSDTSIWQYFQGSFETFNILKINYNNFFSSDYYIIYGSSSSFGGIDINATENYFYQANSYDLISAKILDTNTTYPVQVEVIFVPFLLEENSQAGIQGDL